MGRELAPRRQNSNRLVWIHLSVPRTPSRPPSHRPHTPSVPVVAELLRNQAIMTNLPLRLNPHRPHGLKVLKV
jgi:hypothetical protein